MTLSSWPRSGAPRGAPDRHGLATLLRLYHGATRCVELRQWIAVVCLGIFGGALAFYLWVYALERTTPTRVTNTMTVNPISASLLAAALVGEPIGLPLMLGIVAVGLGIWLASSTPRPAGSPDA